MSDENNSQDLEKFADDLSTIKSLLLEVEEKSLFSTWVFFTWGGLILAGTIAHFQMFSKYGFSLNKILLFCWLPVFLIAVFLETLGWFQKLSKESMPLFSRPVIKMWLTFFGVMASSVFTVYVFIKVGEFTYAITVIHIFFGVYYLIYAQVSLSNYFIYGYMLIATGIILYLMELPMVVHVLLAGLIIAISFFVCGIITWRFEKKKNGR